MEKPNDVPENGGRTFRQNDKFNFKTKKIKLVGEEKKYVSAIKYSLAGKVIMNAIEESESILNKNKKKKGKYYCKAKKSYFGLIKSIERILN